MRRLYFLTVVFAATILHVHLLSRVIYTFRKVKVGNVTIEVLLVDSYCYLDTEGHGKYFNGTQSTDEYGIACMNDAKCRNPDGNINGPYCQV